MESLIILAPARIVEEMHFLCCFICIQCFLFVIHRVGCINEICLPLFLVASLYKVGCQYKDAYNDGTD